MALPLKKSTPVESLSQYLILIYGKPGIGKTTLAAQFEDPYFLMFEAGAKALSLYQDKINSWKRFLKKIKELESEPDRFKTVVLDTYARAYELCMEYVCADMGIDHPTDAGYGKAWNAVDREFTSAMSRLSLSGRGTILICHSTEKEIEQPDGSERQMIVPDATKQAMKFLDRSVDLYAYYYYAKNGRPWIRIKGTEEVIAKNRIDGHFEGISKFEAGNSAREAYRNFMKAFNTTKAKEKKSFSFSSK